jgi:hypothetical protein
MTPVLLQSCRVFQLHVLDFCLLRRHVLLAHDLYPRHVDHMHVHCGLHVYVDPRRIEIVHH